MQDLEPFFKNAWCCHPWHLQPWWCTAWMGLRRSPRGCSTQALRSRQATAAFHRYGNKHTQNSTRSRPLLPVQEQSYHQQWSNLMVPSLFPGFAPYSSGPCLFSFSSSSWHFRLEKEITAWPSAHGKAAVLGHLIYLIPFKGKLTSFNKSHLMYPRKVGRGSFQTW